MPFNGPRFGPRAPMHNPRFKQFPPHMQHRMHYGPRQPMKPRLPAGNNFKQPPPQNNQNVKIDTNPNKVAENVASNVKEEPKTPQAQNIPPKIENKQPVKPVVPKNEPPKPNNVTPIKVVTSPPNDKQMRNESIQNVANKPKVHDNMTSNTNGNYSTQTQQRDNRYYSNQQRENYYQNSNESRNNELGNRKWQQGRQDYNKMGGDKIHKPFYTNDRVRDKLRMIAGPQMDLPPLDMSEKKFNSYGRLFVGNLQKNITSEDLQIVFSKYGEIGQIYVNNESAYAFINFDFKANALKAMRELDNTMIKGRAIKVRIAAISDGIRVKNLAPTISNELLERAFSVFGNVESCKVIVDDRGMPTGEGTVIFKDKKTAFLAVKKCTEECFILSGTARPVVVSTIEQTEVNEEGYPESTLPKTEEYMRERSVGPHFADEGTFEAELAGEWKKVYQLHEERKKTLESEFYYDKERIEKKLVLARVEFEKEKLRKELAAREAESAHLRRHFDADMAPAVKTYPEGGEGMAYESYGPSKRPTEASYDSAYTGSYDATYKEPYDRPYGREYDRGYGREYERAGYASYHREGAYDRGYEAASVEMAPAETTDRAKYDVPPLDFEISEAYQQYDRQGQEAYKPNKRPRY